MTNLFKNSHIYVGRIMHRRFSPKKHHFDYKLYMLALDVDEVEQAKSGIGLFGFSFFKPLRFVEKDYLLGEPKPLSERIKDKVVQLGGSSDISRIVMLVQVRCFGIYFSPVNFYFCYDYSNKCNQMLAEVSNTPWNERHCYLVNLAGKQSDMTSVKRFQVSPFMDMAMKYYWQITPPDNNAEHLKVKIENRPVTLNAGTNDKVFDACLVMTKKPFNKSTLFAVWCQLPAMTIKVVTTIYWQALKLLVKRVPFIGYQKAN